MSDESDEDGPKLGANTQVRLTPEMTVQLDAIKDRIGCSKHAAIRLVMQYGLRVDAELQALLGTATSRVVAEEARAKKAELRTVDNPRQVKRGTSHK